MVQGRPAAVWLLSPWKRKWNVSTALPPPEFEFYTPSRYLRTVFFSNHLFSISSKAILTFSSNSANFCTRPPSHFWLSLNNWVRFFGFFRPWKAFFRFLEITKRHGLEIGGTFFPFSKRWVNTPFKFNTCLIHLTGQGYEFFQFSHWKVFSKDRVRKTQGPRSVTLT